MLSVKCAKDENPDAMTGKRRNQRLHNSSGLEIERADRSQASPSMFGLYPFGHPVLMAYDRQFIIGTDDSGKSRPGRPIGD